MRGPRHRAPATPRLARGRLHLLLGMQRRQGWGAGEVAALRWNRGHRCGHPRKTREVRARGWPRSLPHPPGCYCCPFHLCWWPPSSAGALVPFPFNPVVQVVLGLVVTLGPRTQPLSPQRLDVFAPCILGSQRERVLGLSVQYHDPRPENTGNLRQIAQNPGAAGAITFPFGPDG